MAYTFKDDGQALTYYREYNKEVGTGDKTLIGNWVEERILRDDVDSGRYALWANPSPDPTAPQQTFSKSTLRPDCSDTFRRTIVHSDHQPAGSYITSNQVRDPGYLTYHNPEKGVRERRLEERAMQMASTTVPHTAELPSQFLSTARQDFAGKELPAKEEIGRRNMTGAPDPMWRKEMGISAPHHLADPTEAGVPLPSQSFGKNTTFSLPIELTKQGVEKDC